MHELFEELEAFDPKWQEHFDNISQAALRADCFQLFLDWSETEQGKDYLERLRDVPDYRAAIAEHQKALEAEASSLPYGYSNLSSVGRGNW